MWLLILLGVVALVVGCSPSRPAPVDEDKPFAGRSIEIFVGSASKPPTEEAIERFEATTGARVQAHFGGSGAMLSQLKLAGRGDIYFPGSSDFMEIARREGLIVDETERRVVYLLPAINVPKGNPKNIQGIEDLARPGVRVGIARPDTVCVGLYAVELLEALELSEAVGANIVTHADSCERTAQLVAFGTVDAVLGWGVFEHWNPERIETVALPPEQIKRIGYIPVAQARSAKDPELARAFIDFLVSEEGQAIFRRWGYLVSEEEARREARPEAPVGGEWTLPKAWR